MSLVADLERALGPDGVISEPAELRTYECDGLTGHRAVPQAVVLPRSTEEVQAAVRVCRDHDAPFVARGAGTGLSGGAVPVVEGIVIGLARMNRILDVDVPNRRVRVQPGVTNLDVTRAVAAHGLFYAPDPSSQQVCTIGGNVAENSGGAHCLKYGFTSTHVLELLVVLADAEAVRLDRDGALDLAGAFVGSEGTLGIATEVVVRVVPRPQRVETLLAAFPSTDAAGEVVSAIIGAGIVPAAVEMMDALTIQAAEDAVHAGLPRDAGAVLLVELDGPAVEVELTCGRVQELCAAGGAAEVRVAADDVERAALWHGRKAAFAAMGRVSPDYYVQDGVVPRTRLPQTLRRIEQLSARVRPARRERVPRRGREPAPARPLRRLGRGRGGARGAAGGRDPGGVRRGGRVAHGRARHRRRQGVLDAVDVLGGRPRGDGPPAAGVRSGRALQPGEAPADAAAVRRGARPVPAPSLELEGVSERF